MLTGNEQGDDPWGSKVNAGNGCPVGHSGSVEERKSQPADADGWNNWTKGEKSTEGEHESWKLVFPCLLIHILLTMYCFYFFNR